MRARAISAVALILVLGFAPIACAAMVSQTSADSHPCCPKHGNAGSNPCAKTGCISNVPALRAPSSDFGLGVPAVVETLGVPLTPAFVSSPLPEPVLPAADSELFLTIHALLI